MTRSFLYVPGNAPEKFSKAMASAADALIFDLEDAVPLAEKEVARAEVRKWLLAQSRSKKELWIRVNPGDESVADIAATQGLSVLTGLVLAKAESVEWVRQISGTAADFGQKSLLLSPLLETASAILDARQIATQPGVHLLQIGEYDLCAELAIRPSENEAEVAAIRSQVVLASAAAGILPPIAPVSVEFKDVERFVRSTELAFRQGFVGRACIHPSQLSAVNRIFTPSEAEVKSSQALLRKFDEQVRHGRSVFVDASGRMADEATIRQARRVLAAVRDGS